MMYEKFLSVIDMNADAAFSVSDAVWNYAETAFGEHKSARFLAAKLEEAGFNVTRGIAGIPTAFKATYGEGHPMIGIQAEYDALSGMSQVANITEEKIQPGMANGHGCGHNLFAGGSFAAALAVKEYIKDNGKGSVTFFGCPGEEGGGGKVFMVRAGVYSGIDAVVSWHPERIYMVRTRPSLANNSVRYTFTGIGAHAGSSPHKGRSALDAAELMNVGANFLREHMDLSSRIHYAFNDSGGTADRKSVV